MKRQIVKLLTQIFILPNTSWQEIHKMRAAGIRVNRQEYEKHRGDFILKWLTLVGTPFLVVYVFYATLKLWL